jgi:quercetin dioxygenase-like cupin family protein
VQHWALNALDVQPHQPQVLQSDDEGRTIVLLLPGGEVLQQHQVHERAWLVVVDGEVEIDRGGEVTEAGPGTLTVFEPNEAHEVRARTDARLLLVLAPWPGEGHPRRREG